MGKDPLKDAEIEVICPRCGYHMARTAARLRRGTVLVCAACGQDIVPEVPPKDRSGSRS